MKKSILLSAAVLMTITAWAVVQFSDISRADEEKKKTASTLITASNTPFYIPRALILDYDISPSFGGITKSDLSKATSVRDFFSAEENEKIVSIKSSNIILMENDNPTNIQIKGTGEKLSAEQINFLRSLDISTSIKILSNCTVITGNGSAVAPSIYNPHLTIVPEKQATYSLGKEELISYMAANNKANCYNLERKKMRPAKLYFTVDATGKLSKINLDKSSGYERIDNAILELLQKAPGTWTPAQNEQGHAVDQEFVVRFGMPGC